MLTEWKDALTGRQRDRDGEWGRQTKRDRGREAQGPEERETDRGVGRQRER